MKIAVLSDIHGHALALRAALRAARAEGFDAMLILGDLLTYGVEPEAVLDLTSAAVSRDGAQLLLGNHDQLYLDLEAGLSPYFDALPNWIQDSVSWTREAMGADLTSRNLPWRQAWSVNGLFAAHANPFDYGNWTYLSKPESVARARDALVARGYVGGVFGHTHRALQCNDPQAAIVTVGSIGQPRDGRPGISQWAMVTLEKGGLVVDRRTVDVDWGTHMAAIRATDMPDLTKDRLCGFFS